MRLSTEELPTIMAEEGRYFFSRKYVGAFRNEKQGQRHDKPWGLWYACGDAWFQWTTSEMPEWVEGWQYLYELNITEAVLQLPTPEEILAFDERYRFRDAPYESYINWAAVANDFPGLEICPYQFSLRYSLRWYYGWDVASGCIWDARGVEEMHPIAKRVTAEAWETV